MGRAKEFASSFRSSVTGSVPPLTVAERTTLLCLAAAGTILAGASVLAERGSTSSVLQAAATAAFALFAWRPWAAALTLAVVFGLSLPVSAETAILLPTVIATGCVVRVGSGRLIVAYIAALPPSISLVVMVGRGLRAAPLSAFAIYSVIAMASGLLGVLVRGLVGRGRRLEFLVAASSRDAEEIERDERGRIADDLHDVIAHDLVAVVMHAHVLERPPNERAKEESLAAIVEASKKALADLRRVINTAAPALDGGLASQRHIQGELINARRLLVATGRPVTVVDPATVENLPPGTSVLLGRTLREAATNVTKHGGTGPVCIEFRADRDHIQMRVSSELPAGDLAATHPSGGYGTSRLKERARLLGGDFSAEPNEGRWVASLTLPLLTGPSEREAPAQPQSGTGGT